MFAGVETGGTKTVCAVGADGVIEDRAVFSTGDDPLRLATLCADFFGPHQIDALGVGAFGPCDPDPNSATHGYILDTPKPGWRHANLLGLLADRLPVPITMTTDVNAAAYGEWRWGRGEGRHDLVYITIGTGVGGGGVLGGRLLRERRPPEIGHMYLPASRGDTSGTCPYHGSCLEGLVSGPALDRRLGRSPQEIADADPAWDYVADVVADALHNLTCTLTPDIVVIGGGVGSRAGLHDRLPNRLGDRLAGYLPAPLILAPALGTDSGVIGAISLAQRYSQG